MMRDHLTPQLGFSIKGALEKAEKYSKDDKLPRYLPLLTDSYGRLTSKEWDYAFYSAWIPKRP